MTQALANVRTTLGAAGLSAADVVSSTTYFTDPDGAGEAAPPTPACSRPRDRRRPGPSSRVPRLPGAIKTEITFVAVRPARRTPRDPAG